MINAYHKRFLKSSSFSFFSRKKLNSFFYVHAFFGSQHKFFYHKTSPWTIRKKKFKNKNQLNAYHIQFLKSSFFFFLKIFFLVLLKSLFSHRPKMSKKKTSCLTTVNQNIYDYMKVKNCK